MVVRGSVSNFELNLFALLFRLSLWWHISFFL
jgi:hypothetical protein